MQYKRIVLKLSGQALASGGHDQYNHEFIESICTEIAEVAKAGAEVLVVVGGGLAAVGGLQ